MGVDPLLLAQLAQASKIMFAVGEDGKYDKGGKIGHDVELRVDGMVMVDAKVLAQNGTVLGLIPVVLSTESEDIMLDDDGTITAIAVTATDKEAVIKAESEQAGLSATLKVKVSNPVATIALNPDDPSISLAADETYEVTATAKDKDKKDTGPLSGSDWTWTSSDKSVATVDKGSMGTGDAKKTLHHVGIITGKSTGVATITVETEGGVMAEIEVTVTGQSITRRMVASSSSNGNNFVWDQNGDGFGDETGITEFNVNLYDIISNDRIDNWNLNVTVTGPGMHLISPNELSSQDNDATKTVILTAAVNSDVEVDTYPVIVTLKSTGAKELRLRFTVEVVDTTPSG